MYYRNTGDGLGCTLFFLFIIPILILAFIAKISITLFNIVLVLIVIFYGILPTFKYLYQWYKIIVELKALRFFNVDKISNIKSKGKTVVLFDDKISFNLVDYIPYNNINNINCSFSSAIISFTSSDNIVKSILINFKSEGQCKSLVRLMKIKIAPPKDFPKKEKEKPITTPYQL